jgi:hypothetical protein
MKGPANKNKINSVCLFSIVSIVNTSVTHFEMKLYVRFASRSATAVLFPHITLVSYDSRYEEKLFH